MYSTKNCKKKFKTETPPSEKKNYDIYRKELSKNIIIKNNNKPPTITKIFVPLKLVEFIKSVVIADAIYQGIHRHTALCVLISFYIPILNVFISSNVLEKYLGFLLCHYKGI